MNLTEIKLEKKEEWIQKLKFCFRKCQSFKSTDNTSNHKYGHQQELIKHPPWPRKDKLTIGKHFVPFDRTWRWFQSFRIRIYLNARRHSQQIWFFSSQSVISQSVYSSSIYIHMNDLGKFGRNAFWNYL